MKPLLTENFTAGAPILPYRICKAGAADGEALQAAAAGEFMFGVTDSLGAAATGDRVDVFTVGTVEVELGATVVRGAQLTADSVGRAVTGAAGNRVVGIARVSGVVGDIVLVQLSPGTV